MFPVRHRFAFVHLPAQNLERSDSLHWDLDFVLLFSCGSEMKLPPSQGRSIYLPKRPSLAHPEQTHVPAGLLKREWGEKREGSL